MSQSPQWAFPAELQPSQDELRFDLQRALDAVVMLHAEVPEDAFTASILGTERVGNAVAIREDGLLLTIGYLITEAETIWLTTNDGSVVAGHPLAYDFATGLGLVQPLGTLKVPPLPRGSIKSCGKGEEVTFIGHGGRPHALKAKVIDKREFAGYWEYVLDEALFTAPAHPQWGGAALVNEDGQLLGIGSLLVQEAVEGETVQGNMIVPIDLLDPMLDSLLRTGHSGQPPRPWLGMYSTEVNGEVVVAGLAEGGPAHRAGVHRGDLVREVAGERVQGLADLWRKVWRLGAAGVEVALTLSRDGNVRPLRLKSADRSDFLRKPQLH
jgi:S1-C subfamily serine protease